MASGKLSKLKEALAKKKAAAQAKAGPKEKIEPMKPQAAAQAKEAPKVKAETVKPPAAAPTKQQKAVETQKTSAPIIKDSAPESKKSDTPRPIIQIKEPESQNQNAPQKPEEFLVQLSPPAPSLNSLIMSEARVPEKSDKLEIFRNVLRRYGEIEAGKRAADIVDEEVKKLLSRKKKK